MLKAMTNEICRIALGRKSLPKIGLRSNSTLEDSNRKRYGQPTFETHPHLVKQNEVNFGIEKAEFKQRRENLVELVARFSDSTCTSVVIIPSAVKQFMVDKIPYFFRQDSDFRYFTGCLQPESVLVIEISNNSAKNILFSKANSEYDERWEGCRFGSEEAVDFFGVDFSFPLTSLQSFLYDRFKNDSKLNIWYEFADPCSPDVHKRVMSFVHETCTIRNVNSPRALIHSLRCIKSPAEVKLMKKTCEIGAMAIRHTMSESPRLNTEAELFATVDFRCKMLGAQFLAYPPVVAAGNNANTIHYIQNTGLVGQGDMVLMDAGCEYHGYTSDITRTWPISGSFSDPQRCVYEAVLATQEELIGQIAADKVSIDGLYSAMQGILGKYLKEAGLIKRKYDEENTKRLSREFCPHHVSHYLGMDVHDTTKVSKLQSLQPGMVITVEPGVYINKRNKGVEECFRGIGVRIEDDILVTDDGCEVLSGLCPKSVEDVENCAKNA